MSGKPRRRPMAKVQQIGLFSREVRERLSLAAAELLLTQATRLTEGQLLGDGHYFGSTMLTIDLEQAESDGLLREAGDVATTLRLARLLEGHDAVLDRIRAVAHDAAERQAGRDLEEIELDVRVRAEGTLVFIDIDVEARAVLAVARHRS